MTQAPSLIECLSRRCTACGETHPIETGQFPPGVLDRLQWDRGGLWWSAELFEWMLWHPMAPADYPGAWEDVCNSLPDSDPKDDPECALVVGSMSPWIECVLLKMFPKCLINVTDHNPIIIDHDRVRFLPTRTAYASRYDLIVSFSSVEHFGLGRYGDPLNKDADLEWMAMIRDCIAPGGRLLLAVPQGATDEKCECWHRIYGRERLAKLLAGWRALRSVGPSAPCQFDWQNQPVMTLVPA